VFKVKPLVLVQLGRILCLIFMYSTGVKNVINFWFLSAYCKLSQCLKAVYSHTLCSHMSDHYLKLLWGHYEILLRIISLFINNICSWSKVILISLALWPLRYRNLLVMSFKVSHSHDYFGSSWSVRCILWLKCDLWPRGLVFLSHVSVLSGCKEGVSWMLCGSSLHPEH